jgi:hypothetical protein
MKKYLNLLSEEAGFSGRADGDRCDRGYINGNCGAKF